MTTARPRRRNNFNYDNNNSCNNPKRVKMPLVNRSRCPMHHLMLTRTKPAPGSNQCISGITRRLMSHKLRLRALLPRRRLCLPDVRRCHRLTDRPPPLRPKVTPHLPRHPAVAFSVVAASPAPRPRRPPRRRAVQQQPPRLVVVVSVPPLLGPPGHRQGRLQLS